jgi:hypothetical protein
MWWQREEEIHPSIPQGLGSDQDEGRPSGISQFPGSCQFEGDRKGDVPLTQHQFEV